MRRLSITFAILALTLLAQTAFAQPACSLATLNGAYGYVGTGVVRSPNPTGLPPGDYSSVGILNFDGKGNVLIVDNQRIGDFILPPNVTYAATYTVDSNCMVSMTITAWAQGGLSGPHFRLVIVEKGAGLRGISLLPGVTVNYVSTAQIDKKD